MPPEDNAATGGDSNDASTSSTGSTSSTSDASSGSDNAGYPANTPVAEMTTAQQAAYWKAQSRKHEQRVKSLGTPDEIKKLRDDAAELDKLRQASMGEQERAVSAARTEAASETAREWAKRLVRSELRAATAGRIEPADLDELIAPMDLAWFLDESSNVDDAKVKTIAAKLATNGNGATGNAGNNRTRFPDLGQGQRETSAQPGVSAGAAAYAARKGRTPAGQTTNSSPL